MCPAGCCARHGRGPLEEICEARTEVGWPVQWASVPISIHQIYGHACMMHQAAVVIEAFYVTGKPGSPAWALPSRNIQARQKGNCMSVMCVAVRKRLSKILWSPSQVLSRERSQKKACPQSTMLWMKLARKSLRRCTPAMC